MPRNLKHISFVFLFFSISFFSVAQNIHKIDSLRQVYRSNAHDTIKITALNSLAKEYWLFKPDSALPILNTSFALAEKIDNKKQVAGIMIFQAYSYAITNRHDSAIVLYKKASDISEKYNFKKNFGMALIGLGNMYNSDGEYAVAITYYMRALKVQEANNDSVGMAQVYNSLGSLFELQGDYKQSLYYHFKALPIKEKVASKNSLAMSYNNIGIVYSSLKEYKKAVEYHQKALDIRKAGHNLMGMAMSYSNLGNTYSALREYNEAINCHKNAYALYKDMNDENGIASALLNLGIEYLRIHKPEVARAYLLDAEKHAGPLNDLELKMDIYHGMFGFFNEIGEYKKAYDYSLKYMQLKDSIFNNGKVKEINELNTRYQTEKKEQENQFLQTENKLSVETIQQQKIISYFIIAGLVLALALAFFIFRSYRQKQRANIIITKQKEEVELQKEIIEEKSKEILDSIHYAKRIQSAVITSDVYITKYAKDNFIFYKPKDIVSGDFYWGLEHKNKFYLATADCTGHGVPGAFMSLLNISILNEAIIEKKITSPDLILEEVRKDIIHSLNPEGSVESKDGMDCILCCFDFANNTLQYAAANNSFYIVREGQLITCKADKMPVGMSPKDKEPFTLNMVQLQSGDMIYLLTDGYPDQFGGPQGKKFKYKQLEELLIANSHKETAEQKDALDRSFSGWKGKLEQVDDVLLIGIRI